jgi:hypothetical protein
MWGQLWKFKWPMWISKEWETKRKNNKGKEEVVSNKSSPKPSHTPPHMEGGVVTLPTPSRKPTLRWWITPHASPEECEDAPRANCFFIIFYIY